MSIITANQKGFSAIIAVILIVIFGLIGTYMATLANISSFNTTQSAGAMQAWFAARSSAEWAVYQSLNRPACTCGADCCTVAPTIDAASINFTTGELDGFQSSISCAESSVTEGSTSYCVYDLGITAERGSSGALTYISRSINLSVTDAP